MMKTPIIILIISCLVLAAGCTTPSSDPGVTTTSPAIPTSVDPLITGEALPMYGNMSHTTPNTTFDVSIYEFEIGEVAEDGTQELTIYIAARNTGTVPIQLVWFSKLTDLNGKTYGGLGISKGGVGARTRFIEPGEAEAARDFVIIRSDRDLEALKKGAILDVYFIERPTDEYPPLNPEYHTRWTIDPGVIK